MNLKSIVSSYYPSILRPAFNRLENSPNGIRLARGVFWLTIGTVISRGLMLVAMILVARIIGKTSYGELGIIRTTVSMFGVFAGFGLGITATKYVAEFHQKDPRRAGRIIGLSEIVAIITGVLMALTLFFFASWLAENTINAPHLANVLRIGSLILFISALTGAQTGALSGFEAFKIIAYVNFFVGLISFPILVCGAYFGGLTGAVWALVINLGINWFFNHLALQKEARRKNVPLSFKKCNVEINVLWKFSLPALLAGSTVGPVNWICSAILVNQPKGYDEMGIYSAANQWFYLLLFMPSILGQVLLPVLSERLGQKDTKQSQKTMIFAIKANLLMILPFIILASIISPYIMNLYGKGFREGWPTLIVVLFTTGLVAVNEPVGKIIAASGKMWIGFVMNFGWAIMFVVSTLLLAYLGSMGIAFSRAIAYFIHTIWVFCFVFWILRR